MEKSTIVCRCEEINIGEIESAVKMGARTFNDIKRLTRCGMGQCQGKICTNLVRQIISEETNTPLEDVERLRTRMPLRITRLEALLSEQEEGECIHD
jgi:NAD(P)H-nitrite reductase large subunit